MRNTLLQRRARALRNRATDAERHLWRHLQGRQLAGHRFRRQVPIAGFIADFACLEVKLAVELDGGQHQERVGYDEDRNLAAQGFRVLRFWNDQVFKETEAVLEQIMRALGVNSPHPNPPPQAGEGNGEADLAPPNGEGN